MRSDISDPSLPPPSRTPLSPSLLTLSKRNQRRLARRIIRKRPYTNKTTHTRQLHYMPFIGFDHGWEEDGACDPARIDDDGDEHQSDRETGEHEPGRDRANQRPMPPLAWLDFVRDRNLPMTNKINIQNLPNPLNLTIQQPKPPSNPSIINQDRRMFSFEFVQDRFLSFED